MAQSMATAPIPSLPQFSLALHITAIFTTNFVQRRRNLAQ